MEKGEKLGQGGGAKEYQRNFRRILANDLNTPQALALLWQVFKDQKLKTGEKQFLIFDFDHIFGLKIKSEAKKLLKSRKKIYSKIKELAEKREKLREESRWEEADKIRQEIEKKGYFLENTPEGPKIKTRE